MIVTAKKNNTTKQKFYFLYALTFIAALFAPIYISISTYASNNPLTGSSLFVDPNGNNATAQAAAWRSTRPIDAALMDTIANQPKAFWMGNWTADSQQAANDYVSRAAGAGKMGVIVAYNIPNRDCGSHSAGGASSHATYKSWIDGMATGIGGRRTVVIIEPDAISQLDCLDPRGKQARLDSLSYAVTKLKASNAVAYLDAGNKGWIGAAETAGRLARANIGAADGFSLNVSNFYTANETMPYGSDVASRLGGKHFVIDTSRSGLGANGEWCNPSGRALGNLPSSSTGSALVDAYLWIKAPGESDGPCNGGPAAGNWWPEYALGLAQRAQQSSNAPSRPTSPPPAPATVASPATVTPKPVAPSLEPSAKKSSPVITQPVQSNVQGTFNVVSAPLKPGEKVAVLVNGNPIKGTTIDTKKLKNGKHIITIHKTDKSGRATTTQQHILVANKLSLTDKIRNSSAPIATLAFATPIRTSIVAVIAGFVISIPSYFLYLRSKPSRHRTKLVRYSSK
jgi:endoglucanase